MVRKICLDSDALIALLRKDENTKALLESLDATFCITAVNSFEVWFGRKSNEPATDLLRWFEIIAIDDSSARLAADLLRELKKEGSSIEFRDIFIGATCITHNIELLTYNLKDFGRMKKYGLKVVEF